jgi:rubrerythrin
MKFRVFALAAAVAAIFFALGRTTAGVHPTFTKQTMDNLSTAMHGEAFAYAKYSLYAEHARKNGNKEVADLFEKAAKMERFQHFAEEAQLAGLVRSDAENLSDAMKGESYEVDTMYFEFAQQATKAGDTAAADRFEEVRRDEMKHRDAFKAALATLEGKPTQKQ